MTATMKQARTTIREAPYYLTHRLPFTAGDGSLSARYALGMPFDGRMPPGEFARLAAAYSTATEPLYVVTSYGTPIAWAVDGQPFTVPDVRYSVTTSRHQGIVRRVPS